MIHQLTVPAQRQPTHTNEQTLSRNLCVSWRDEWAVFISALTLRLTLDCLCRWQHVRSTAKTSTVRNVLPRLEDISRFWVTVDHGRGRLLSGRGSDLFYRNLRRQSVPCWQTIWDDVIDFWKFV